MKLLLLGIFGFMILFSITPAFAEEITVNTDKPSYSESDIIVISGIVTTIQNTATLQLFSEGNLVDIAQVPITENGSYSHTVIAEGSLWKSDGIYIVEISDAEGNIAESQFNYFINAIPITTNSTNTNSTEIITDNSTSITSENSTNSIAIMPEPLQETNEIPTWVKGIFVFWTEGQMSDDDLVKAIKFLVNNEIIVLN